jgi:hypothetical protein
MWVVDHFGQEEQRGWGMMTWSFYSVNTHIEMNLGVGHTELEETAAGSITRRMSLGEPQRKMVVL